MKCLYSELTECTDFTTNCEKCKTFAELKGLVEETGKKYDTGKLRWDLLPLSLIEQTVNVLTFGAQKYGAWNCKDVPNAEDRYFAALMRHIVAWKKGEKLDVESGLPHLAHAVCNLIFLSEITDGRKEN